MICPICKMNANRNYTHARNKRHLKALLALFKKHKANNFISYYR